MILGLDASTKCVGWCRLNDDGSLYDVGYIWLEKIKNEYRRYDTVICALQNLQKFPEKFRVYIEAPLQRSNNQNVVNILQRWNGMVSTAAYRCFATEPILIPETTVRKLNGIKIPKGVKGTDKKKYVLQCVRDLGMIDESKWEYKRTGNPKDYCFDMADAFCVARAGFNESKQ